MVFTAWGDEIEIEPAKSLGFSVEGKYADIFTADLMDTSRQSKNLIIRAVWLMADKVNKSPDFHIHVVKNIPSGAGLGGGSSDAATIMRFLNEYWDMGLSLQELCAIGLTLGAELPVCLYGCSAKVQGIGDIITPVKNINLRHVIIVWPDQSVLTKDVFDAYRQSDLPFSMGVSADKWMDGNNDLTSSAIELCPEIATILSDLSMCDGCIIARMSGSGSACFGVFESAELANVAAQKFKNAIVTAI
jgi:4-diphosphocytidyl-2-C-methyl-D-erythritol kinase